MNSLSKRILSTALIVVVLFTSMFFSPPSANAFVCLADDIRNAVVDVLPAFLRDLIVSPDPWYNQEICAFKDKVFDAPEEEIFGERYTYAQVGWIINSTFIHLAYPLFRPIDALQNIFTASSDERSKYYASLGLPGLFIGTMQQMYTDPPASAVQSTKQTLAKFSIIKPVSAQLGYGYSAISAVQNLWIASRNMAYLLLVIFLIAAGFMVIFRIKINPQTSVSIQLMVPRIISTLILITFSYAIAGLVIDMVYVVLSLIIGGLSPTIVQDVNGTLGFFAHPDFGFIFFYYILTLGVVTILMAGTILGAIPALILLIIVFFLLFKIWWMMMKTYIMLIFQIIIGPWQIMLGLLPGQQGFGPWVRGLIANASVFIVVPLMFMFNMILWEMSTGGFSDIVTVIIGAFNSLFTSGGFTINNLFTPGAYNLPEFPLLGAHGSFFHLASGYVILAIIPKTAEMVRDALKIPAFKYGSAFGEALATPIGIAGTASSGQGAREKYLGHIQTAAGWEGIGNTLREATQKVKGL